MSRSGTFQPERDVLKNKGTRKVSHRQLLIRVCEVTALAAATTSTLKYMVQKELAPLGRDSDLHLPYPWPQHDAKNGEIKHELTALKQVFLRK